jgi:predicted TIM-barrel fold metal-dependent hydrolase
VTRPIVDCHVHVLEPDRFPYVPGAGYQPRPDEVGTLGLFDETLQRHGVGRALVVQPSGYGTDNACLLDTLARSGWRFRGIAVIDWACPDRELVEMKRRGVVGVRLNLPRSGADLLSRPGARDFLARVAALGWLVQVYAGADMWAGIEPILRASGVTVLIDHMGEPDPARGVTHPGFQAVLRLGREAGALVKLSAPYRVSEKPFPYDDVAPFVTALLDAFGPERCVWGSDWPFLAAPAPVDYGRMLEWLGRWVPDAGTQALVLRDNPARLFGFVD